MSGPTPGIARRADSYQPAEYARCYAAGNRAGRRAFRRLGVMLMREVARARAIRQQHGHVVVGKTRSFEIVDDAGRLLFALRDTDNRFCHDDYS